MTQPSDRARKAAAVLIRRQGYSLESAADIESCHFSGTPGSVWLQAFATFERETPLPALTAPDRVGQVVAWLRDSGAWGLLERVDRHIIADAIEAGEHGGSHAGE